MLPGVKNKILDHGLGVLSGVSTGKFAAIGVSENTGHGISIFTDPSHVQDSIGDGPLRDLIVSALSIAKTTVYALPIEGTVNGVLSAVTPGAGNTGTGTVSASGTPRNEYDFVVEIVADGGRNTGVFRLTIDSAQGKKITIPEAGVYEIPGTGLTITFSETGFLTGDTFSFSATAPAATSAEILAAVDQVIDAKLGIEFITIAGVTNAALWASLASVAESAAEKFQYLFFVCQARYLGPTEDADDWVLALSGTERGSVVSNRLQVCAGYIMEADRNGQIDLRGIIGTYCGLLARRNVHEGPDAVKYGAIPGALSLEPAGISDGHIEALLEAGYVTAIRITGLNGIYITSARIMSEEGSDFDVIERRRVMDKACSQVRTAQLVWVNDAVKLGVDGSPEGIKMLIAQSEAPLRDMKTNGEISDGYVIVPEGQNILSTKTIVTKVRIVPLGKVSYIENEIAYSNPSLGGEA